MNSLGYQNKKYNEAIVNQLNKFNHCSNLYYWETQSKLAEKLISYCRNLKEKNVSFYSKDFTELDEFINDKTFVYLDPPYLITLGSYNDGKRGFNGWNEKEEKRLLDYLAKLNKRRVKFMLSNVLYHKEKSNQLLIDWAKENGFKIVEYDGKARKSRNEVIIINYEEETNE